MALSDEKLAHLIQRLEVMAEKQPGLYRWRVGGLALLGYGYLFGLIITLMGLAVLSFIFLIYTGLIKSRAILLPIIFLLPGLALIKALWIRLPAPEGTRINRRQAPELFNLLDDLSRSLKAPRFNQVLLNDEFNAAVCQIPQLGVLGWPTNYLLIGLPLIQSLTPDQFRAVLAHEMGHLSGRHARFSNWIYRIRLTWSRVLESLTASGDGYILWLVNGFLNWYVPFFNAYSFVLARRNEYEADDAAAQVTDRQALAEALVTVRLKAPQVDTYWQNISAQIRTSAAPPAAYSELMTALRQPVSRKSTQMSLTAAFEQATDLADTHPCLRDRLTALGLHVQSPEDLPLARHTEETATDRFLGESLTEILQTYDQDWQSRVAEQWRTQHAQLQAQTQQLQVLTTKSKTDKLTPREQWQRAYLTLEIEGFKTALPMMQEFLTVRPHHPAANYNVGLAMLKNGNPDGIDYIKCAIEHRYDWLTDGCELIYQFWHDQGNVNQAAEWQTYYQKQASKVSLADHERIRVSSHDKFLPHGLSAKALTELRRQVSPYPEVAQLYLAQKAVKHFPGDRLFVIGVVLKEGKLPPMQNEEEQWLEKFEIDIDLEGRQQILILNSVGVHRKDLQQVLEAQGALVYRL